MSHHREIAAVLVSALAIVGSSLIYRRRHEPQPSLKTAPWDNLVHTREPSDKPSHQPRQDDQAAAGGLVSGALYRRLLLLFSLLMMAGSTKALIYQAWNEVAVFLVFAGAGLLSDYGITRQDTRKKGSSGKSIGGYTLSQAVYQVDPRLTGYWIKDHDLSDSIQEAISLLQFKLFARQAVKLFKGFRISVELGHLEIQALIHIPFFHVKAEKYSLGGEERDFPRRDLRKGNHHAHVEVEADGSINLACHWGQPFAGEGTDLCVLKGLNELHIITSLRIGNKSSKHTTVFKRSGHMVVE